MNRLIKCELTKEFKKIGFKILILIIIISSFLTCYISNKKVNTEYVNYPKIEIKTNNSLLKQYNKNIEIQNKINNISENIKLNKIMNNGITLLIFFSIIIIIISSSILGNEINKKSIKELLTKPYNRCEILISKFLCVYIMIFLLTIFSFITYILFVYFLSKTNIFLLKDYVIYKDNIVKISFIIKYLIKYVVNSIPLYFLSTFTIFLTTFIKNQKVIIPINILLFIMSPVIFNFFLNLNFKYIIYSFIPYLDFSIFKNIYSIFMLNIEYNVNFNIFLGIIVLVFYSVIFLILSLIIFGRRNFY